VLASALVVSLGGCGDDGGTAITAGTAGTAGTAAGTAGTTASSGAPPATSDAPSTSGSSSATTVGVDSTSSTAGVDGTASSSDGSSSGQDPMCMDADGDGHGRDCAQGPDCDDNDDNVWTVRACVTCLDSDGDGTFVGCDQFDDDKPGLDCDDGNDNVWTDEACATCMDVDGDDVWLGCDAYDRDVPGPDCDDTDLHVWTERGCAGCVDADSDDVWAGCDAYDMDQVGPDCDDGNPVVGTEDLAEVCDGLSQNCAGEIDPLPAGDMCPPEGVSAPNVGVWACAPLSPGEDGCTIQACEDQFFDLDGVVEGGCECAGTSREVSLAACGDEPEGYLGFVTEGTQLVNLPIGTIPFIDNGIGNGAEDWYSVEFPDFGNPGVRPLTGSIRVDFAINDNNDYRFEVFRSCAGLAWANGLATQFGAGAPPAREWWFFDNHQAPAQMPSPEPYQDNVAWPSLVYIRVFRVQNDNTCNTYRLRVQRVAD
jgi:hypothetical protein